MRCSWFLGLAFAFLATNVFGQFSVSLNEDSNFVLSGQKAELVGVEFESPSGVLVPASDAGPFQFLLMNNPTSVTFGSLRPAVDLDGELVFPVSMAPLAENDVQVRYGTLTESGVISPTGSNPAMWDDPLVAEKKVDGVNLYLSQNRGLAANQFSVSFYANSDATSERITVTGTDLLPLPIIIDSSSEITIGLPPSFEILNPSFEIPEVSYSEDQNLPVNEGVSSVALGSWDLLESFSYNGEVANFEFNGERAEVYQDGTFAIPDGWLASPFGFGEIVFTAGDSSNSFATPEPSSFRLAVLSLVLPLLFRSRDRSTVNAK